MSNNSANSPININPQSITGKCDLKCAYNFDYPTTSLVAKNEGFLISFKADNQTSTPVIFNNNKYVVDKFVLVSPSLHLFNETKMNAELIIIHTSQTGGSNLTVCIPIKQSSDSNDASNLLTELIQMVSTNTPSSGETSNLNISNFTLDSIVPKKPFYNYINTNSEIGNCIVFGSAFAIPLSNTILTTLTSIIKPLNLNMIGDGNLFFNSSGPNLSNSSNDGIYISCKPTGSSEETIDVTNNTNINLSSSFSIGEYMDKYSDYLWYILFVVILIAVCFGLNFIYKIIVGNSDTKISGVTKSQTSGVTKSQTSSNPSIQPSSLLLLAGAIIAILKILTIIEKINK
jgi:hypothetical protein